MAVTSPQNKSRSPVSRFVVIFIIITIILFFLKTWTEGNDIDYVVLLSGNAVLFLATLASFFLYNKALHNNNANTFVRFIYTGMFLKMAICLVAAMIYIFIARSNVSKFGLFGCLGLYIIYTFVEVKILMQLSKQQKNV